MTDPTEAALDRLLGTVPPPGLPAVPKDYFERVEAAAEVLPPSTLAADSRAERLERVVDLGLSKMQDILEMQADPSTPEGLKLLNLQNTAATSALNVGLKVDENHFRKRSASALVAILAKITAEERAA